jgi:hypothetical protein
VKSRRLAKGSIIAFSTALACVLVVLGVGFVFMLMYMGGQQETKNATDAGALNVGKQALDKIKVTILPNSIFYDCTSDTDDGSQSFDGNMDLRRINRVWAKAMLIGMNAKADSNIGQDDSGQSNADSAFQEAKSISDQLAAKLNDTASLYDFFTPYSLANSVRMIGPGVSTTFKGGSNWSTSLMDRTPITKEARESNIIYNPGCLPPGFTMDPNYITGSTRTTNVGGGLKFLKGYTNLAVDGHDVWQVPFQYDQKPRLVSRSLFDQSTEKATPIAWDTPIPNAFSVEGQALRQNEAGQTAMSWVLTNPHSTYQMSMPHTFVRIHLDEPKTIWMFFPAGFPTEQLEQVELSYGWDQVTDQEGPPDEPGGLFCASVIPGDIDLIGSDVVGRSLDELIFTSPPMLESTSGLEAALTARFNQMISKSGNTISTGQMHDILGSAVCRAYLLTQSSGAQDFIVFSPDGGNSLTCLPKSVAENTALWLKNCSDNTPDGSSKEAISDTDTFPGPFFYTPEVVPAPFCTYDFSIGWGFWEKDLHWQPGTGYNGSLGTVTMTRDTKLYNFGICTPVF